MLPTLLGRRGRGRAERAALGRAAARLERLALYPEPLRRPLAEVSDDLLTHELCHVWQDQDHRLRMWLSYLLKGYARNPHEIEARRAARRP